jgi:23S rRNA pseudouridine1911/1915/1917 synthase
VPVQAGPRTFVVSPEQRGTRLDSFLGKTEELGSRSKVAALIKQGRVLVDGEPRPKSHVLAGGETVVVQMPVEKDGAPFPEKTTVTVPYEDEWLLVVDKPAGMAVHPAPGHPAGTLANALLDRGAAGGEEHRPGIVHRLDKDTSGLLVVAKSQQVYERLVALMKQRAVDRRYLALVHGSFGVESGTIEAPVGRDPARRKSMAVGGVAARDAVTHFTVLERLGDYTLVEVRLETGRTHQIRVHFLAIGHPVVGDRTYARRDPLDVGRQFLHSRRLSFVHPMTGERVDVTSEPPPDLAAVLARLRQSMGGSC